ncbi:unnamed protein product [Parascedosporium putredinis]|uniref:DUF1996 domain-containing protein n=1 Tax=Parascedosporium putredinis TaxID=1442378 RepID=A0A9P1MDB2_9PEZI|nr:unnamed protein product [Parascedosporium putredinis]CAI8000136.1 unnamed protein product [Parascedosporium putredinis]
MKYSTIMGAAMFGAALAAKDSRTFSVMRFNGKEIFNGRADPIVNPGATSPHEHTVFGGSAFGPDATGESLSQSKCTNAKLKGDKSAYWVPRLYFHDEAEGTFEPVPVFYTNIYYFFDATDDDIKAFPKGLSILAGDASTRNVPQTGGSANLDPKDGEINNVMWTCPRSNLDSPGWVVGSDGSAAGIQDPNNKGQGVGFPSAKCDGYASPLRADIHFPSCYNPEVGLTNYKENMAWPSSKGTSGGRVNCPEGYIHVPHLFMEVYWDTPSFSDRWTPKSDGEQPFVLSNGDVTGYSLHADFLAAWDEDLLQNIIDNCNTAHAGMETCPGVGSQVNTETCVAENSGLGASRKQPLSGFKYGAASAASSSSSSSDNSAENDVPVSNSSDEDSEEVEIVEEQPQSPATTAAPVAVKPSPVCVTRTKTVVETVTVYEDAVPTPEAKKLRRHLHKHAARHGSHMN